MHVVMFLLVVLLQPVSPATVAELQRLYESGRYQDVVNRSATATDPQAVYWSALGHQRLGRIEDARRVSAQLAARGDGDPWSWIGRSVQALLTAGASPTAAAVDEAQRAAERALALLSGNPQANPATSASAAAQPDGAAPTPTVQNRPAQRQGRRNRSTQRPATRNRPGPAPTSQNRPNPQTQPGPIVSPGPARGLAHYQLGQALAYREQHAEAAEAFERAIELMPSFAYGYYYAGMASSRVGRPDRMAINFERFLQLAPNAPEAPRVQALMRSVRR